MVSKTRKQGSFLPARISLSVVDPLELRGDEHTKASNVFSVPQLRGFEIHQFEGRFGKS